MSIQQKAIPQAWVQASHNLKNTYNFNYGTSIKLQPKFCCYACCCQPCAVGDMLEEMDPSRYNSSTECNRMVGERMCASMLGNAAAASVVIVQASDRREKVSAALGINDPLPSCCTLMWCDLCLMVQEYAEIRFRKGMMSMQHTDAALHTEKAPPGYVQSVPSAPEKSENAKCAPEE